MAPVRSPKVVLLGMMTKMPVAGVVWQTIHYLSGFERLGYEAYYVEAHARTPSMLTEEDGDDGSIAAAEFIRVVMDRFGLGDRWAYSALHADGAIYGMSEQRLAELYQDAALIINLHGGTLPRPEHAATDRLIYLETDPGTLQVELEHGVQSSIDFLEPHSAFFTFAENLGQPDCGLPVSDRFPFVGTRQPVVLDMWDGYGPGPRDTFTTVANWRQPWRDVTYRGATYRWSKHHEFERFIDLPTRTKQPFELALSGTTPDDVHALTQHGWTSSTVLRSPWTPMSIGTTSAAHVPSSPWPRTRTSVCAADGSAIGVRPTSRRGSRSSPRTRRLAPSCPPGAGSSPSRRWTRSSTPWSESGPISRPTAPRRGISPGRTSATRSSWAIFCRPSGCHASDAGRPSRLRSI